MSVIFEVKDRIEFSSASKRVSRAVVIGIIINDPPRRLSPAWPSHPPPHSTSFSLPQQA
jgi:hypothetical protein